MKREPKQQTTAEVSRHLSVCILLDSGVFCNISFFSSVLFSFPCFFLLLFFSNTCSLVSWGIHPKPIESFSSSGFWNKDMDAGQRASGCFWIALMHRCTDCCIQHLVSSIINQLSEQRVLERRERLKMERKRGEGRAERRGGGSIQWKKEWREGEEEGIERNRGGGSHS